MEEQYETIDKYDRKISGLLNGNNIHSKSTTLEEVGFKSSETYIVQTIRVEDGDHVAIKFIDKDATIRIVLPPRVVNTMVRQRDALTAQARSSRSRAAMKERMASGWKPTPPKRKGKK